MKFDGEAITPSTPTPQQVRAARLERGHTQAKAAATILTSEAGWRKWEAGDRRMHPALWWLYLHGGIPHA